MTANTKASKPGSWETRDPVLKEEEEEAQHSGLLFDHMYTARIALAGPPTPLVTSSKSAVKCRMVRLFKQLLPAEIPSSLPDFQ